MENCPIRRWHHQADADAITETRGQPGGSSPVNSNGNAARSSVAAANSHPKLVPRPQPAPAPSVTQPLSHGFSDATTPTTAAPVLDPELSIHPTLRSPGYVPTANMMPSGVQPPPEHPGAVPMPPSSSAPLDGEDPNADGRKAKRELSQSKRAAQNRAAQVRLTLRYTLESGYTLVTETRRQCYLLILDMWILSC